MERLKTTISAWLSRRAPSREIPFVLFCATCLQLAFLKPYVVMIPGERANLFSGLLCALALGAACSLGAKPPLRKGAGEVGMSLALGMLMIVSGFMSLTPGSSSARGFVVLSSGLGGFWCARILLATESRRRTFVWLSSALLGGILLFSLTSYLQVGNVYSFLDPNPHPLATKILLLWFAPLTLLVTGSRSAKALAVFLIVASYLVFYLSSLRSAVLIPFALCIVAFLFQRFSLRYLLSIIGVLLVVIIYFFGHLPDWKLGKEYEPAYYRVENYPFSWHIATKHPFLGIGLRAPREEFLKDYETKYPYVSKEQFLGSVQTIRSSENIFLTFMVEVGFPFILFYGVSLFVLLRQLLHRIGPVEHTDALPPIALLLPLTAALLHCLVFDALLHPQVSWFFHILLGLIPTGREEEEAGTVSLGVESRRASTLVGMRGQYADEGEAARVRRA